MQFIGKCISAKYQIFQYVAWSWITHTVIEVARLMKPSVKRRDKSIIGHKENK